MIRSSIWAACAILATLPSSRGVATRAPDEVHVVTAHAEVVLYALDDLRSSYGFTTPQYGLVVNGGVLYNRQPDSIPHREVR